MTLAISMLENIFLLHAKTQDYHLKYPMRYSKCHNVEIILAISKREALRPRKHLV
jgi:hypothetical protein